ncbi:MAG: DUF2341 domain-containing protein [Methanothrix sp.]|nr:DUF2341 domain-containing protein [Methanothrix sp.]
MAEEKSFGIKICVSWLGGCVEMMLNWKTVSCLLLLCGVISASPVLSDPTYESWTYNKEIEVQENSGEELIDYQVLVSLDSSNFDFSKAKPDGSDLRFVSEGEELGYWIEDWDAESGNARIWVKVPIVPAEGVAKVLMYYGNEAAATASDGNATFEFFDDFESGNFDKWDESSGWNISSDAYQGDSSAYASGNAHILGKSLETIDMSEGILEGMFKFDEISEYHYPYIPHLETHGPYLVIAESNGHFGYWPGSGPHINLPVDETYEADKWYNIRLEFSYPEKRYWVYINDKLTTPLGLGLLDGTNITGLQHLNTAYSGSGGMYVDVSKVRNYASVEPTITLSFEASKDESADAENISESTNQIGIDTQSYAKTAKDIALDSTTLHPQLRRFIY